MKKGLVIILILFSNSILTLSQSKDEQDIFFQNLIHEAQKEERKNTITPDISLNYRQEDGFGGIVGLSISNPRTLFSSDIYISTKLSMGFNINGHHYSKKGRSRLEYSIIGYKDNRYQWGIGYENGTYGEKSLYTEMGIKANIGYKFIITNNIEITPAVNYELFKTKGFSDIEYPNHHFHFGLNAKYDNRDNPANPSKGLIISLSQKIYPAPIFNTQNFFQTKFIADLFATIWKGGVMAIDLYCESNYGDSPWYLWTPIGGETRMRGYYNGRYRDKNSATGQLEIRQNIYKAHGVVLWGGVGYVFPSFQEFSLKDALPNYGIGYRLDTSSGIMRIDIGFGKGGEWGIIAGISHAF